ncbi:hypothetical protein D3C77_718900 [compost metagenome]
MTALRRTATPNYGGNLFLELEPRCDQCGRPRNQGKHDRCSKRRQALNAHKWN